MVADSAGWQAEGEFAEKVGGHILLLWVGRKARERVKGEGERFAGAP